MLNVKFFHRILSLLLTASILVSFLLCTVGNVAASTPEFVNNVAEIQEPQVGERDDVYAKCNIAIGSVSVPAYDGGKASNWMTYDCGIGVTLTDTGVQSKMCIVSDTNKSEFNDYCIKLQDQGYQKIFSRKITGNTKENIFGKFLSSDGSHSVYVALFPYLSQTRIMVDNHKDTLGRFSYTPTGSGRTEIYLYSLSQPHDGWGTGSDEAMITQYRSGAGSMLFMKMSDNSLYIIDGGGANQMGDRSCDELYQFLRKVTGVAEGQRMTINTWHISHPHTDHITGFTRFIKKYHKEFELLNILYNFDIESTSRSYLQTVAKLFPQVKYYKPHTGDQYTVSGVTFDVLYTTEDRYQPNSSNKLILNDTSCIAYTHENNTSMVVQVNMDGKKVLLTGDLQKADATLMKMYPASVLQSHVMQIPHHGIDNHTELAKTVAPEVGFTNQSKKAVMSKERYYTNNSGWYPYIGKIYYAGTETVGYAADSGVFYRKAFEGYDYLKWSDQVYELGKENPYNGENFVTDPEKYYRYTQATEIKTSNRPYIIVDDKLGRVLSYDAVGSGGVKDALPSFYDGTHYYFSDSQRRLVNWLIKYATAGTKSDAAISSAVTTYYDKVMIKKWQDDYWGTPTKNHAVILGKNDTFSSEGMFGTWASCSQQFDTSSNSTWIDKLSDNTFVIYRNNNGTYYPFYRDGNIATERGWGISKLTQSKINSMRKYVKTRLYLYEDTPSTMKLSWTGHKDYYVQTEISEKDLTNLLISDIRVNYSFDSFAGGGEIFHTSQNKKDGGTYWFEYTPAYDPAVARNYTATIKYRTAKGTILDVGTFTLHTEKIPEEVSQALFFDFGDTAEDRDKYFTGSQYAATNFDGTSRWLFKEYDYASAKMNTVGGRVDTKEGSLVYQITHRGNTKKSFFAQTYSGSETPLTYVPKSAEVVQLRFKTDNLMALTGGKPAFRLWYYTSDGTTTTRTYDNICTFGDSFPYDGTYVTLTMNLYTENDIANLASTSGGPTTTLQKVGTVKGIEIGFYDLVVKDISKDGAITVDYIYIGPKSGLPLSQYTVTFCNEDGTVLRTEKVYKGQTATYTGATPTKEKDNSYHYTFKGWNKALTNITGNMVVTAQFTPIVHSYTYGKVDNTNHKGTCSCGYAVTTAHSWNSGTVTTQPTCTAVGVITYTCNTCKGTKTEPVSPLGHSYVYTSLNGLTHQITCKNCNFKDTVNHTYHNGTCICGEAEIKEPIQDSTLKLSHSLNLASDISVNMVVPKSQLQGFDMGTVYVESVIDTYTGNTYTGTTTIRIDPVDNGIYYYFTLNGLTAIQMNDMIRSTLYGTKDGQPYYSPVDEYSIATYAYSQMNNPDRAQSLKILCADLLRYGSAAQIFKSYRLDALADSAMTDAHKAYLSELEDVSFGNTNVVLDDFPNAPITWAGKSLNLESKVALKFVFNPANYAGDLSALTLRISYKDAHGNTKTATAAHPVLYNAQLGYYVFTVDSLLAAELRAVVSVQIYAGNTPVSATLQYSPDTYGNGKSGALLDLCKALFAYSDSAKAYFAP